MSEAFQIGIIGAIAAIVGGLLTALLQPLWTNLLGKRSKLTVEINHYPFSVPQFIVNSIEEYLNNYKLNVRPKKEVSRALHEFHYKAGYSIVQFRNRSKKAIEGIVVHLEGNAEFWADLRIDGENKQTQFVKSYQIGALRAGGECTLKLWSANQQTFRWNYKDAIAITAQDYDKISIHFPPTDYIVGSKILLSRKFVTFTMFILATLILGGFIIGSSIK